MSYDPSLGRFLELDPIGSPNLDNPGQSAIVLDAEQQARDNVAELFGWGNSSDQWLWKLAGGMNSYEFSHSNPVRFVDPSGLDPSQPGRVINDSQHSIWVFDSDNQKWSELKPGNSTDCNLDIDGFYDPKQHKQGEVYKVSGNIEALVWENGVVSTFWNMCSPQTCWVWWLVEALVGDLINGGRTTPGNIGAPSGPTTGPTTSPAVGAAR